MKVVTLLNEKGGVAKTTLANHLAAGLAVRGNRVVLIDSDPQASATVNWGINDAPLFHDLLVRDADWQDSVVTVPPEVYELPDTESKGELMIVPGHVETRSISSVTDDPWVVVNKISELRDMVDYVIFDTSPTPSLLHGSIYMATDALIYPTHLEFLSFRGLIKSIERRENSNKRRAMEGLNPLHILGIVPTMYRKQTLEHTENLNDLKAQFGAKVWQPITQRTIWTEASRLRRPVWSLLPNSKAAKEVWELVDRFEKEIVNV